MLWGTETDAGGGGDAGVVAGTNCAHGVVQSIVPWSPVLGGRGEPTTLTKSPIKLKL
jgi:hypothetical protein